MMCEFITDFNPENNHYITKESDDQIQFIPKIYMPPPNESQELYSLLFYDDGDHLLFYDYLDDNFDNILGLDASSDYEISSPVFYDINLLSLDNTYENEIYPAEVLYVKETNTLSMDDPRFFLAQLSEFLELHQQEMIESTLDLYTIAINLKQCILDTRLSPLEKMQHIYECKIYIKEVDPINWNHITIMLERGHLTNYDLLQFATEIQM